MENVRNTIKQVSEYMKLGYSSEKIKSKFPEFNETYPKLFNMLFEPNLDLKVLEMMITHVERIENGESQEDIEKKVGFELAKTYIYPKVDMSKEINYKQE